MSSASGTSKQVAKQPAAWTLLSFVYNNASGALSLMGLVGGVYLLGKFAQSKLKEYADKMAMDRSAKENLRKRFEQNQHDCSCTISSLLPNLSEPLLSGLNVEAITQKLQQSRREGSTPIPGEKNKLELWEDVKLLGFTRTIAAVYIVTLLTALTHVQLNLLGRFIYLDSVKVLMHKDRKQSLVDEARPRTGLSIEAERKFLTFGWYLLNIGWKNCVDRVRKAVDQVIGNVSLKESTTYDSLLAYLDQVRAQVEYVDGDHTKPFNLVQYLLPPEGEEAETLREGAPPSTVNSYDLRYVVDAELKRLLDETRDFLESPDFNLVLGASLDDAFNTLAIQLRSQFFPPQIPNPSDKSKLTEVDDATLLKQLEGESYSKSVQESKVLPLAGVLPSVSRQAHLIINGSPNVYIQVLTRQPALRAFSAIIYTAFEGSEK
ncbi:hypothetical protein SeMB42_g06962 [Synchytrium endobioticum]|uniref:DRBM domain-containing protein n=1 Tax=Synchytrium endobioticum TaxID=286115 RepID=A0A507D484_9FUNG|nr:hypothetical protein SeMB42_g06962 [Synchytrium endobioticum]TPX46319.1 hypothetical protein SeLEV6574_g03290 [Synchytrium endobioticum]